MRRFLWDASISKRDKAKVHLLLGRVAIRQVIILNGLTLADGVCPHQVDGADMDLEVQGLLKCRGIGLVLSADPVGRLAIEEQRMEETNRCMVWLKTKE